MIRRATAFAPATVGNVAVGFDILGLALEGLGERVTVTKSQERGRVRVQVDSEASIPTDPRRNTASAGLLRLLADRDLDFGFDVEVEKSIPIGSGLGGSAASAVGAVVAANALLRPRLSPGELLHYAVVGEQVASGSRHADNVAPCLEGGLVLVKCASDGINWRTVRIPTPSTMTCVVMLPNIRVETRAARKLLKPAVPLSTMVEQSAHLAGFLAGCYERDFSLIGDSLRDLAIEPQRARLVPHFSRFQDGALASGALGCSLSGSGPALFALARNRGDANQIARAWRRASAKVRLELHGVWISPIARKGARLVAGSGTVG